MADMTSQNGTKTLVRSRKNRMIAGVCAGIAEQFGMDVTLFRVLVAVITVFTGGVGILAYIAAWVLIPEEGEQSSIAEEYVNKNRNR